MPTRNKLFVKLGIPLYSIPCDKDTIIDEGLVDHSLCSPFMGFICYIKIITLFPSIRPTPNMYLWKSRLFFNKIFEEAYVNL